MSPSTLAILWLAEGVPGLLCASLLVALGDAFRSGAGEALLYRASGGVALFLLCFLMGVVHPLRAAAIQRLTADDTRARAASMAHLCDMALSAIALPAAGLHAPSALRGRR